MLAPMKKMYDTSGPNVVKALNKRQFEAYYCSTAAEAVEKVLELIPVGDVVCGPVGYQGAAAPAGSGSH